MTEEFWRELGVVVERKDLFSFCRLVPCLDDINRQLVSYSINRMTCTVWTVFTFTATFGSPNQLEWLIHTYRSTINIHFEIPAFIWAEKPGAGGGDKPIAGKDGEMLWGSDFNVRFPLYNALDLAITNRNSANVEILMGLGMVPNVFEYN